ncbi:unnamed protein product [Alopecurus aequalis]
MNMVHSEIAYDLAPFIRTYKDGSIERLFGSSMVPASEDPAKSRGGALTRDVVIDQETGVSARLFLPSRAATGKRLPLVIYIHGGAFCTESAFCRTYHRYATSLAACSGALVVSVEYRLAPEHPIPTAYHDAWAALRWVSTLTDPWIATYADTGRAFLAGDSAGANIAYHTAVRASREGGVLDILGLIMVQPFFWGPEWLPSEKLWDGVAVFQPSRVDLLWPCITAGRAGNDDLRINPPKAEIASLTCRHVLVAVAQKDTLVDRGRRLAAHMSCSPWIGGNVTLVESEDEDHGFHLFSPLRATSKKLMEAIAQFIYKPQHAALSESEHKRCWRIESYRRALSVPTRPFMRQPPTTADMEVNNGPSFMAPAASLMIGHGKSFNRFSGRVRNEKGNVNPFSATLVGSFGMKHFLEVASLRSGAGW